MPIIQVKNVVKSYRLGQAHNLRESLKRLVRAKSAQERNTLNALNGVDFEVEAGEVLGIIGTNGAGKSTLLKVLAGITTPSSGGMVARGRVAPLIEVGAGLIAELTGRENIFLNGVILGMSVKEIRRKFDDIVAFAELEKFIDTPIKRYSSGMAVRLGFAIATSVECEILIVDEVLAVGDIAFQRKCFDRIEDIIKKQGKTILLVSHNIRQVERLCTRAMLLDRGRIVMDGETRDVCRQFYERTNAKMKADRDAVDRLSDARFAQWPDIDLLSMQVLDGDHRYTDVTRFFEDMVVEIRFRTKRDLSRLSFAIGIHTSDMLYLATHDSERQLTVQALAAGVYEMRCVFRKSPLVPGVYSLRLGISERAGAAQVFYGENLVHFQVSAVGSKRAPPVNPEGFLALDGEWEAPVSIEQPQSVLETA